MNRRLPLVFHSGGCFERPSVVHLLGVVSTNSIFEEAGILDPPGKIADQDGRLCKLRKQYRMHAEIGELANVLVYARDGHSLEHCADSDWTETGCLAEPCSGKPLLLCDTSPVDPWCARQSVGSSRYNVYRAPWPCGSRRRQFKVTKTCK